MKKITLFLVLALVACKKEEKEPATTTPPVVPQDTIKRVPKQVGVSISSWPNITGPAPTWGYVKIQMRFRDKPTGGYDSSYTNQVQWNSLSVERTTKYRYVMTTYHLDSAGIKHKMRVQIGTPGGKVYHEGLGVYSDSTLVDLYQ